MTITPGVKRQYFAHNDKTSQVIRLPTADVASPIASNQCAGTPWTEEEHERFLDGLEMFPNGPWRRIATHVATRTSRQTMTHAQKYRQRLVVPPRAVQSSPSLSPSRSPRRPRRSLVETAPTTERTNLDGKPI